MQTTDHRNIIQEDYPDRSGCGPLAIILAIIVVFFMVMGCIYLFT